VCGFLTSCVLPALHHHDCSSSTLFSSNHNATSMASFRHALPPSRLGKCHATLQEYKNAIAPLNTPKHYTLVIVTEPHSKRILLGLKQRGFGKNMYNSFGGKAEDGESLDKCACRELQEETGISVTQETMQKCHVGILKFAFDDSDTEMVVHVFRVNISTNKECMKEEGDTCCCYVDPTTIRPCEEIVPEWFESYHDIPLHNMFADDSLWLTQLLTFPPSTSIWMEGHFYFEPGGQEVNSIRHYYLSFNKSPRVDRRQED